MPRAIDPEQERVANMRRRAAMLMRHARATDPDTGKSSIAVAAGRAGGQRTIERYGSSTAWGLSMALRRHYGVRLPDVQTAGIANADADTSAQAKGGNRDDNTASIP